MLSTAYEFNIWVEETDGSEYIEFRLTVESCEHGGIHIYLKSVKPYAYISAYTNTNIR